MIYITEVHVGRSETGAEHIEAVRWESQNTPETGESTLAEMVEWIGDKEGFAHVRDAKGDDVEVRVVTREGRRHLQTVGDGIDPNNLLSLPRYGVRPR